MCMCFIFFVFLIYFYYFRLFSKDFMCFFFPDLIIIEKMIFTQKSETLKWALFFAHEEKCKEN